ncbi:hypothetical protein BGZ93_010914 [Podila epicladia]|nr:hypothetical protein BGZ92_009617 [Podila epicladia]KAG0087549.1 hypothetical protein BGZ93_010914 [Podila epicladia]
MNSKVVVCGNVDSTLCVWDIHPAPGTSSSTLGTIHTASYLASTMPPGIEDWVSGIEHICVGDSLVACSTEFSGSVLVFSLATGSLVYEIPGLYQPSKMCMTDFFLLTGGRGAWNRGGRARAQVIAQGHGPHHGHGQDVNRLRNGQNGQNLEVDEYMSCCVNVWDLRTGERLYSLIPRLPISHFQHPANISSMIHGYRDELMLKGKQTEKKRAIRTSSYSPDICSGSRLSAPSINSNSASSTWATRVGTLNNASIVVPSPIAGSGHGSYARSRSTSNSPSLRPNAHGTSPSDSSVSSSSSLSSLSETSFVSTPSEETSQTRHAIRSPPKSPQSPVSAPLTLLDIAVTPDHSTLVVTLCERSGEGREGVYIWDFSGTRLEGYHEQGQESGSTIIVDKNDLRLCANGDSDDGGGWDEGDDRDLDILYGSTTRARDEPNAHYNDSDRDNHDSFDEDDEDQEDESDAVDIDNQFNNNMIMQQVDSTAFSALHQARITGKVWIGWKMAERDFQILRHRYVQRLEAEKRKRQLRRERQMKCREKVDSNLEPKLEQLSVHG